MKPLSDEKIIDSWQKNARAWIEAISNKQIQSRTEVTNQAIIEAILRIKPRSVLDIGCGEGWLVRQLSRAGIDTLGIDAVAELIDYANRFGVGRFKQLAYEDLGKQSLYETFDLAVANFSLLGKESVEDIFAKLPGLLYPNGFFVIQTLHPVTANGDLPYKDGWREGSWVGFNDQFSEPAPWYFRTLQSWQGLFSQYGFTLRQTLEPVLPQTGKPISVIFIAQAEE